MFFVAKNTTFSKFVGFNFATNRIYNVVRILCHSLTCMQRGIIMFTMFSVISFPYMLSVMPESNHRFLNFVHTLLFEIIIILYYVEIRMIQLLIFVFWKYKKNQDNFKLILMWEKVTSMGSHFSEIRSFMHARMTISKCFEISHIFGIWKPMCSA